MTFGIYSIKDAKTSFLSPTFDQSDAAATRNFNSSVMRSDGLLLTHCSDFSLYKIGEFNVESGIITPLPVPLYLASGSDAMRG